MPVQPSLSHVSFQQGVAFTQSLPPLSVYIHVPWCVRKCPYCDFNSHAAPDPIPEESYLAALEAELIQLLPHIWGRPIHTVFIGGGTPSLLAESTVDRLLCLLRNLLNLPAGIEITMEANPGTFEVAKFKSYAQSGINRLSLGVQTFSDPILKILGRIHTADQACYAIEQASRYVDRLNLDLMYGLPTQDLTGLQGDIDRALSFGTEHLSLYNLTLEPNTVFAKYPPDQLPNDDEIADMQDYLLHATQAKGFEQYEVSAYSQPKAQAKHNLNYWMFGDYLGLGPGAHGKISFPNKIVRTANTRSPQIWAENALKQDGSHHVECHHLDPSEIPFEFMLNALRLKQGVPNTLFSERTGLPITVMQKPLQVAIEKGLLSDDPLQLKTTDLGWRFLNDVQALFL